MAGFYFLAVAALVFAGFFVGRSKAQGLVTDARGALHSLPAYHGLLTATTALVPMLLVFAVAMPVVNHLAVSNALDYFDPQVAADPLQRGAALREIQNVAAGQYGAGEQSAALKNAAGSYAATLRFGHWVVF